MINYERNNSVFFQHGDMVKTTEGVQEVVAWAEEALAEQVEGNLEITLELWMKRNEIYTGSWMNFYNNQYFENSCKNNDLCLA